MRVYFILLHVAVQFEQLVKDALSPLCIHGDCRGVDLFVSSQFFPID